MHIKATYTLNIFIAYHPKDKDKFEELYLHLLDLNKRNKGYIINKVWYDGQDLSELGQQMIREMAQAADMILLLLSEDSILSPYFSGKALQSSLKLHESGKAIVVPIILNTCWWEDTAYRKLEVLPRAGLPIYDSANVKNELFDQVIEELDNRLNKIQEAKIELEETFKALLAEANSTFQDWEQDPKKLRAALPLFREALEHWREGFVPHRDLLEARIDLCLREIDFRHYAKAAHEAYAAKDYQTAYFNCKDALALRNDAVIRKLFSEVSAHLKEEELKVLREPFDKHLSKAQEHFLALEWADAQKEFVLALEFYEAEFQPSREVIEHKIEICRREKILEESMNQAYKNYKLQKYSKSVDLLLKAIKEVNREAFDHIDHMIKLAGYLENVSRFMDEKTKRWGYYNSKTNNVIIAPKYLAAYDFSENLAGVKKWDKWGFIDIEGNEVISFVYDFVGHFRNGVVEVIQDHETFYINHLGERVEEEDALRLQTKVASLENKTKLIEGSTEIHELKAAKHDPPKQD
jgi:hypothetical protein